MSKYYTDRYGRLKQKTNGKRLRTAVSFLLSVIRMCANGCSGIPGVCLFVWCMFSDMGEAKRKTTECRADKKTDKIHVFVGHFLLIRTEVRVHRRSSILSRGAKMNARYHSNLHGWQQGMPVYISRQGGTGCGEHARRSPNW